MQDIGNYYVINHLVMFTGLSDRTIRNYIASGVLQGEKINGLWHFTEEQIENFVRHPAVRPSILAKKNALVYDFLLNDKKTEREICMILDVPGVDKKQVSEYFCYSISQGDYSNIDFSFDGVTETARVILKGNATAVLRLINDFEELFVK